MQTETIIALLKAAGEVTRLRLLVLLGRGEFSVKDLTRVLGQSQPRVSRHLKLLGDAGLIERYQEGSWVLFRLADAGAAVVAMRMLIDMIDKDDDVLVRDWARAQAIRAERHAAAQAYFRANAAQWDHIRALHVPEEAVTTAMQAVLGPQTIPTLVDIGTGTGHVLEVFAQQAESAIGLDINRDMLGYARARVDRLGLSHVQLRHADLFALPLADGCADVVVIHQVLHFLEHPGAAITEATRILKPGGRLLVVDFAPHELDYLREKFAHRRLGFARDQLVSWLTDAGLRAEHYQELENESADSVERLTVALWLGVRPSLVNRLRPGRNVRTKEISL